MPASSGRAVRCAAVRYRTLTGLRPYGCVDLLYRQQCKTRSAEGNRASEIRMLYLFFRIANSRAAFNDLRRIRYEVNVFAVGVIEYP